MSVRARGLGRAGVALFALTVAPPALAQAGSDSTFAVALRPTTDSAVTGISGTIAVLVVATRTAHFSARLTSANAATRSFLVDSTSPAKVDTLSLRLFDGDRQLITTGDWELHVTGTDSATGDTRVVRHAVRVNAPIFALAQVPVSIDSSRLLPEYEPPRRARNLAIAAALGGVTYLIAKTVRADAPVRAAVRSDQRAVPIAVGLAAVVSLGAWRDKGRALTRNAAANMRVRVQFDELVRSRREENDRLRREYRATIRIGELLP